MTDLSFYIEAYHKNWDRISKLESYKWIAFRHFKENNNRCFPSFNERISAIFGKAGNLLSSYNYFPLSMLKQLSNAEDGKANQLELLFEDLMQSADLITADKIKSFIDGTNSIMWSMAESNHRDWNGRTNLSTYQDAHSISVYLAMFYPNDFYIYKYGVFRDFAKIVNVPIVQTDAIERLLEFQELCQSVKVELKKDQALIEFYKHWLKDHDYEDDNLNLLTQDFIYAVATYLNSEKYKKIKGNKGRVGKFEQITANELTASSTKAQRSYIGVKGVDYHKISRQNSSLGFEGELWVVNYEKERLLKLNLDPNRVEHSSKERGDGCGYDVLSLEDDGETLRYIEVKTTAGDISQPLFFTDNELRFSIDKKKHYYLYRVYNFKSADKRADLTIVKAGLDELNAEPVSYRTKISHD